jgi:cytochrome c oxidase subunit 2
VRLALLQAGLPGRVHQSALEAAGPQAAKVESLWWFAFWIAVVVYVATIGALLWAAWRARRRMARGDAPPRDAERRMGTSVSVAVGATVAILLVFLGYDLVVGRTLTGAPVKRPLTIEITGRQWWWEVHYADTSAQGRINTANEIHVPVGQPVVFLLSSHDVIHSFWVPNLGGKKDLVPGRLQSVWFQADTPGVYRGQCAEFCGLQHAKMAFQVIAEPPERYAQWANAQRQPASPPSDAVAARGQQVFLASTCAMCHAVAGTRAGSSAGPDLTHLASRRTIAASTLPNTRGNLAGWIVDPQRVKPGANMPPNALPPRDLDALLTYLQSLR